MQVVLPTVAEKWQSELEAYIRDCLPPLRLWNWTITVAGKPDSGEVATSDIRDDRNEATIRVGEEFMLLPQPEQVVTIAHELAHLHPHHALVYVETLKKYVPPDLWDHFWTEFERKEDVTIEELARVFVPLMPPMPAIRWPKKRKR